MWTGTHESINSKDRSRHRTLNSSLRPHQTKRSISTGYNMLSNDENLLLRSNSTNSSFLYDK